jgi:hypothetical protein
MLFQTTVHIFTWLLSDDQRNRFSTNGMGFPVTEQILFGTYVAAVFNFLSLGLSPFQ